MVHLVHDAASNLNPVPGGRDHAVTGPFQRPRVEALAKRPFVGSGNNEFYANPFPLSEPSDSPPREIRKRLAPGLESSLNRFATFHRLRQVGARHDDVVYVESP